MARGVAGQTSLSYNYDSEMEQASIDRAFCLKVKRRDGTIFAFTELDVDIAFDLSDGDGEITYVSKDSIGLTSDIQHRAGMAVDRENVRGILSETEIDDDDVRAGKFDHAEITLFSLIWSDLTLGARIHRSGWLGEIKLVDGLYEAELSSLRQAYQQRIVENCTPFCRANLGDSRCGVPLSPSTWQASTAVTRAPAQRGCTADVIDSGDYQIGDLQNSTVYAPTTPNGFWFVVTMDGTTAGVEPTWNLGVGELTTDANGITYKAIPSYTLSGATVIGVDNRKSFQTDIDAFYPGYGNFWRGGILEWLTGDNAGTYFEVARDLTDQSPSSILLYLPTYMPIQAGDTFKITAGCNKSLAYCTQRFFNTFNFRGEPYVPGTDVQLTYPDGS